MGFLKVKKVKVLSLVLVVAIMVGVVCNAGAIDKSMANDLTNDKKQVEADCISEEELPKIGEEVATFTEDGVDYVVTTYKEGDTTYSQVIDKEGQTRKDIIFSNNNKDLEINEYEIVESEAGDETSYIPVDSEHVDFARYATQLEIAHNHKCHGIETSLSDIHFDSFKSDVWYSNVADEFMVGRLCSLENSVTETYTVTMSTLNEEQKAKCEELVKAMEATCPKSYFVAGAMAGTGVGVYLAALATGGIGALIALVGGGYATVKSYYSWKNSYENVLNLFEEVKSFSELVNRKEVELP